MKPVKREQTQDNPPPGNPPSIVIIGALRRNYPGTPPHTRGGSTGSSSSKRAMVSGGVWRENTYPGGAACDVPSQLYSISSAPNPTWGRRYAEQRDILAYLRRVVDESGLLPPSFGRRPKSPRQPSMSARTHGV